jgi:hypothetical protein
MLLNAQYSNEERQLILKYAKAFNKQAKFVTMKEFLFNEDNSILKFK